MRWTPVAAAAAVPAAIAVLAMLLGPRVEQLSTSPAPAPTLIEVDQITLPKGVNQQLTSGPPPVVPAPAPELDQALAEAAAVDWVVPEERRNQSDGIAGLPGSDVRPIVIEGCKNKLVQLLARVGFRGEDLREAWAIAMRETGGRPEVGPGHPDFNGADFGLFQFNKPSFAKQPWWNDSALIDGEYNARVAYYLSRGGKTWYLWGLDGKGRTNPVVYASIWSSWQIDNWITKPYQKFYAQFPC